jgi:hypothetical protein
MEFLFIKIMAGVPARPPWYLVSPIFFDPICAICDKGPISMLWCSDYAFQIPLFSATISRTRFSQIPSFLRFDDMNTRNERVVRDKLAPILIK